MRARRAAAGTTPRALERRFFAPLHIPARRMSWARRAVARLTPCAPRLAALRLRPLSSAPTLRPYQEECVEECLLSLAAGVSRIGVSSPTGSGKVRRRHAHAVCRR